jgi:hypothetical protein
MPERMRKEMPEVKLGSRSGAGPRDLHRMSSAEKDARRAGPGHDFRAPRPGDPDGRPGGRVASRGDRRAHGWRPAPERCYDSLRVSGKGRRHDALAINPQRPRGSPPIWSSRATAPTSTSPVPAAQQLRHNGKRQDERRRMQSTACAEIRRRARARPRLPGTLDAGGLVPTWSASHGWLSWCGCNAPNTSPSHIGRIASTRDSIV